MNSHLYQKKNTKPNRIINAFQGTNYLFKRDYIEKSNVLKSNENVFQIFCLSIGGQVFSRYMFQISYGQYDNG